MQETRWNPGGKGDPDSWDEERERVVVGRT